MSYVQQSTVLAAAGVLLILIAGWLFALITDLQRETRKEVEQLAVKVGQLEILVKTNCK